MTLIIQALSGRRSPGVVVTLFSTLSVQALPANTSPQPSILHEEEAVRKASTVPYCLRA